MVCIHIKVASIVSIIQFQFIINHERETRQIFEILDIYLTTEITLRNKYECMKEIFVFVKQNENHYRNAFMLPQLLQ